VIGTPLSHVYPRENAQLQRKIAREFLLISSWSETSSRQWQNRFQMEDYLEDQ